MRRAHYENTLRLKNVIRQSATTVPLSFVCRSSMCMYVCMHHMCCSLFLDTPRFTHTPNTHKHTHYVCKYNSSYETGGKREREKRVLFHNICNACVCAVS